MDGWMDSKLVEWKMVSLSDDANVLFYGLQNE